MADTFISTIEIDNVRNIDHFEIQFSNHKRQHLIITGKNGCGKTTLVQSFSKYLEGFVDLAQRKVQGKPKPGFIKQFKDIRNLIEKIITLTSLNRERNHIVSTHYRVDILLSSVSSQN